MTTNTKIGLNYEKSPDPQYTGVHVATMRKREPITPVKHAAQCVH